MKISKLLPVAAVFASCVGFNSILAQDNPAQAAARAALMKQMGQAQAPEPQTPPAASTTPATPAAPAAVSTEAAQPAGTPPADPNAAAQEKARAALLAKMAEPPPKPATIVPTVAGPVPIIAPAIPISMTKEQRLQELLAKYKADQVTPEQYHTQRAAILAEP